MTKSPVDASSGGPGCHRRSPLRADAVLWRRPAVALLALIFVVLAECVAFLSLNPAGLETYSSSCPSCHA